MGQHISPPTAAAGLRHDRMPDRTGWTVYDAFESRPVRLGGIILAGLSFEDAEELVRILNRQELEIEREARRLVLAAAPRCPALPTTLCVREAAHAHR